MRQVDALLKEQLHLIKGLYFGSSMFILVSTALPVHRFPLIFHLSNRSGFPVPTILVFCFADIFHCRNMEFRARAAYII